MTSTTTPVADLARYGPHIHLDEPFVPTAAPAPRDVLAELTAIALDLLGDTAAATPVDVRTAQPCDGEPTPDARALLRAVLTVRAPGPLPVVAVPVLDALLGGERDARPRVVLHALKPVGEQITTHYPAADRVVLWRGDITTLGADAIVNAANRALLGCFQPFHTCIDNAIHSAAGPQLRDDCNTIVELQGHPEPTGTAKLTRGYHLPAPYVLHTVGPVVHGDLRDNHADALASAYRSCLDVAAVVEDIRSVAFCSISTGVFGYPKEPAARVALQTVADWLDAHPGRLDRIVIDVFGADDEAVYRDALSTWRRS